VEWRLREVDRGAHLEAMGPEPGPGSDSLAAHGGGVGRRGGRREWSGGGAGNDGDEQRKGGCGFKISGGKGNVRRLRCGPRPCLSS
jgi:hypothetical protein